MKKDTQLLFIHLPVLGWSRERKTSYKFITKSFKISKGSYSAVAVSSCKISEATRQALPVRWKSSTNIPSKGIISGKGLGIGKVFRFPGPLRCVVQQSRRCYCSSVLNYAEQNGAVFPRKHVFTAKLLRAHPAPPFSLSCGVLHTQTSSWWTPTLRQHHQRLVPPPRGVRTLADTAGDVCGTQPICHGAGMTGRDDPAGMWAGSSREYSRFETQA